MRLIGKPYTHTFEPEALDLWLRHHLRCWWRYTGRYSYKDYAEHVRVTEETIKQACLGLIYPPMQVLSDMRCVWNPRNREYEITIQRRCSIEFEEEADD